MAVRRVIDMAGGSLTEWAHTLKPPDGQKVFCAAGDISYTRPIQQERAMSDPLHIQAQAVVAEINQNAADARSEAAAQKINPRKVTPDGYFGMDGYLACGAIVGGLYGGIAGGWLGGIVGGIAGFLFVLITVGPVWYWWTKNRGWSKERLAAAERELRGEKATTFSPFETVALPRLPRLPTSARSWTLGGLVCGASFGVMFTQAIDLAEEMLRGAVYFGIAGAIAGYCVRWVGARILRR
jgi:predicted lipid-binding transport protein (Tim44 family)